MFVSTIQLPPSIENSQGYSFDFMGNTKSIDEDQENVYWFQLHNPQIDRSSTSKSTHIVRCFIPPPLPFLLSFINQFPTALVFPVTILLK